MRSQNILTLSIGSVVGALVLAVALTGTSGAAGGYPPSTIASTTTTLSASTKAESITFPNGVLDVAPGTASVLNANGTVVVAKIEATSGASVGITAGSLGLSLGGTYTTSVAYSASTSTVTLSNGVTVNLTGLGLEPGSTVEITLYSSGTVVGKGIVAADGTYSIPISIPPAISAGNHTIVENAVAKNGKTVKFGLGVKIAAPKNVTVGPFISGTALSPVLATQVNDLALLVKAQDKKSVLLTGYTDITGTLANNILQSQFRARSVAAQLSADLKTLKVTGVKIATKGLGPADPVATNKTNAGQINNRRVVATLS